MTAYSNRRGAWNWIAGAAKDEFDEMAVDLLPGVDAYGGRNLE
jgi:hypothetical protein